MNSHTLCSFEVISDAFSSSLIAGKKRRGRGKERVKEETKKVEGAHRSLFLIFFDWLVLTCALRNCCSFENIRPQQVRKGARNRTTKQEEEDDEMGLVVDV